MRSSTDDARHSEPSSKPACDSLPCSPESQARHAMHVLLPVPVGDRRHCPRHTQRHRRHTLPERQGPNAPIRNPSSTRMRSVPAQNRPRRPHADSHPKRRVHHPAVSRANTLAADATRTRDPRGDRLSRGRGPVTTPPSTTRGAAIEPWRASARRRDTTYPRHAQRTGPGLRDDPRAARALSFSTASPSWSCRLPIQEKAAHPAASRPNTPAADATHTHTPGATGSPRDGGTTTTTPSTTRGVATKPRERAPEEETTTQGTHTRFYQASEATRALPGHSRSPSSPFHGRADSHPKREAHQSTAARANTPADDTTRTRDPRGDRPSRGRAQPRNPYSDHVHQTTTEPRAPAPRSPGSRRPNGRDAGSPGQPPAPDGHPAGGPHPLSAPGRSQSSKQANQTPKQAPAHETGHGRNKARQRYENWTRKRPSHPTQPVHRVFPTRPHRPTPPTRTHPARAPPPARHPPQWTASPRCTRATAHHHKNQSNAANATPGHAPGHKLFTAAANTTT